MADDKRFVKVYSQGGFIDNSIAIYVDKVTGVNYLFTQSGYAGGMTVLVNADGTPVITPVPREYDE